MVFGRSCEMMDRNQVESCFNKKFDFLSSLPQKLPQTAFRSCAWKHCGMQAMKEELNRVKALLSDFNLREWSEHTKQTDPSSVLKRFLKRKYQPELLTQAWCKFYEVLSQFPLIPSSCLESTSLVSLHLCEAPGGFICALNHYLVSNSSKLQWRWFANSLNPHYEGNMTLKMIPDDRLIKYTLDQWCFGLDGTGDITKYYNHSHLVERMKNEEVNLITADGSIDCMDNPGEQENIVSFLHYCEVITALAILCKAQKERWNNQEKMLLESTVQLHSNEDSYPSIAECSFLLETHNTLKHRSPAAMKTFVYNAIRKRKSI